MHRTPLFSQYGQEPGVKLSEFAGWQLPIHFDSGITTEHHAVRQRAGLFDISHMGRCVVTGPGAANHLDYLVTNAVLTMETGQIIYTLMCYPNGTVVDDLIIYRIADQEFMVVMNAANTEKDLLWMREENPKAAAGEPIPIITDLTRHTAQIALQGPLSEQILAKLTVKAKELSFFRFLPDVQIGSARCLLSRNGYTGEDGFEIYCDAEHAEQLWQLLLEAGKPEGLLPCGLGSRDTLRLEARLPLYGHEISDAITPLEANLGSFVKLEKKDFCGKEALMEQHLKGIPRSLRGIEMVDPAVPRNAQKVFLKDQEIGFVTSGTKSPTLGIFCGYVLIGRNLGLAFGDGIEIEINGKRKRATLVKTPFYKRTPARL